jgi:type I restriction-modification system DNA methylase subunit
LPSPFNNQGLFSDYYLLSVVPTMAEWDQAKEEASGARQALRDLWAGAEPLVSRHEGQTEEHWIRPVLRELGFSFQVQTVVADATGVLTWPDYALFDSNNARTAAEDTAGTSAYFRNAVAIADAKVWDASLDRGTSGGSLLDRRNPNYQIDAYLRDTGTRWGLLTNGRKWRLYSRDTSYRLDSFLEVDLLELLDSSGEEFNYFWLFFRAAAFREQPRSFLDRVRAESTEYAESLSSSVKERVYEALAEFVNGFFAYPENRLDPDTQLDETYAASLILLYRILFTLYAEAHALLPLENPGYRDIYSIKRLKEELAMRRDQQVPLLATADNYFADLSNLFSVLSDGAEELDIPAYNGGLFSVEKHPFLTQFRIGDRHLAKGLDLLARVPSADGSAAFVDYKTLQVRHLGDIYEGLLEYEARFAGEEMVAVRIGRAEIWTPATEADPDAEIIDSAPAGTIYLATGNGERRATGSYYTPQRVVEEMVDDSVGRLVADLEESLVGDELVTALKALRVCDPAMGSGHFLVEVVDHLARAVVRAGGEATDPAATQLQAVKRDVVERCVFGVDLNPLAVELAKLSLWLTTVARDRPLSFIDAHLICGNSLIGADIVEMSTLNGASDGQMNFVEDALGRVLPDLLDRSGRIEGHHSDTIDDVQEKERLFEELNRLRSGFIATADLWTANRLGLAVTEDDYLQAVTALASWGSDTEHDPGGDPDVATLNAQTHFHHWELAFPEVFLSGVRPRGFDAVVTNPPYVSAIERRAGHTPEEDRFWRQRFSSAQGPFDMYLLFMELALKLTREGGWVSLITPNKFLAAPYASGFRQYVVDHHSVIRLVDASRVPVFDDPSVYPVITLFRAGSEVPIFVEVLRLDSEEGLEQIAAHSSNSLTRLPENIWAFLLLEEAELLVSLAERHKELEGRYGLRAVASTSAAEAERFGAEIREEQLATSPGWKVIGTGTISAFCGEWGVSRFTHRGNHFLRPVLPFRSECVSDNRRNQYWAPKLIFKKLCNRLEAQLDPDGTYASLNTNFVLPGEVNPYALAAILHSSLLSWIYEGYFGALRMGGGYLQVQAPQLRVLPVPDLPVGTDPTSGSEPLYERLCELGQAWHTLAAELAATREQFATEMLRALGLQDRREEEPAFVLPRWSAIVGAVEAPDVDDLAAFWPPVTRTARQLNVDLTPRRKGDVLEAAQRARPDLLAGGERLGGLRDEVDDAVFELYGLSEDEAAVVRSGHSAAPALAAVEGEQ